ncbi:GDSL esterase/lipase At5g55050-like isoform X2 [Punica granatum]|uniref:GDSL esterase/lipase At5g55050-like isoform X2 n=1 Tax=Punica granatum TaxID=22663 RepID=A0A6P8EEK8_PUNGR|nr:GDSL esterase/lipase At5g55050-like isoform X2 [Punica granatum]
MHSTDTYMDINIHLKLRVMQQPRRWAAKSTALPFYRLRLKYIIPLRCQFRFWWGRIFNITSNPLNTQSIPLWQQVEYYLKVHEHLTKRLGSAHAQKHLSKSLFFIVFGSNNILDYSRSIDQNKPPKMHVNQMTTLLKAKLKILHTHGARKFMVVGLPPVGCCPAQRIQNETRGCREDTNTWTVMYKEALESMSQELKSEVKDMSYSYSHTYPLIHGFIQDPASNGLRR